MSSASLTSVGWHRHAGPCCRGRLALSRMPVALGDPSCEAPASRPKPFGELRVERGDLVTKLKEAKLQHALTVARVRGGGRPVERRPAFGAGHVARLRVRAEHRCKWDACVHH